MTSSKQGAVHFPKALIDSQLPPGVHVPDSTRKILHTCCIEFAELLVFEANEKCTAKKKKSITPEDVLEGMKVLELFCYQRPVLNLQTLDPWF